MALKSRNVIKTNENEFYLHRKVTENDRKEWKSQIKSSWELRAWKLDIQTR